MSVARAMPELPEVETVRRLLEPDLVGARVKEAWADLERITMPSVGEFIEGMQGRRILEARRHGKQLYFPLDDRRFMLAHLGMTGRLHVERDVEEIIGAPHVHGVLFLSRGRRLVYHDPRTFGFLGIADDTGFLSRMGPDPSLPDFDEESVVACLEGRSVRVKAALLDQRFVAGLGNIYADEVCWQARVHPEQRLGTMSRRRLREVVSFIRPVLERALEAHGATLKSKTYETLFGVGGDYLPDVYERTGEPCNRCGTVIRHGVLSGRSYHFCPRCQRKR
ncbi:MAG: bifunctional DNA-formamidopyrimidine glycosylase/DNA-(apurinic or apyrimidinic site) lyase [Armatimonadetes bacterium]|nr:bifunctional DNA-formamidopyrimidine glycosylase/DNA-(apurinic or apyrimidinic site) lyase [Armatimonadota bacterium]